jgi:hypothetical protein
MGIKVRNILSLGGPSHQGPKKGKRVSALLGRQEDTKLCHGAIGFAPAYCNIFSYRSFGQAWERFFDLPH